MKLSKRQESLLKKAIEASLIEKEIIAAMLTNISQTPLSAKDIKRISRKFGISRASIFRIKKNIKL